jgi:DNA-binding LacI/PurR family transcriptional regulator
MKERDHLFQNLLIELHRQIVLTYAPGEKLPSKRELATIHGVSSSTIQSALQTLAAQGAISIRPGVGCMRALSGKLSSDGERLRQLRVGIVTPRVREEWPDYDLYPALVAEGKRRGMEVVEVPHRFDGPRRSTPGRWSIELDRVPWNTFDVGLLVEAENTIKSSAPALQRRKVVAVDMDATAFGIDSVAFMDSEAGAIAARHLLSLGHQNFVITDEANVPGFALDDAWTRRRHGFELAVGAAGGVMRNRWRLSIPRQGPKVSNDFYLKELPSVVKGWMDEPPRHRPTAMFAVSFVIVEPVLKELAKAGAGVPRDFSIVTITANGRLWMAQEPAIDGLRFTSADVSVETLASRAYQAVEKLASETRAPRAQREPKLFLAPATLLPGGSTAPPPRAKKS